MGDIKEMQAPAKERRLLILGAGGFGRVVYELAEELGIYYGIAFLDDAAQGENVVGKLEDYQNLSGEYTHAIVAIGNNALRLQWMQRLEAAGYRLPVLRHPTAWVSGSARVGQGSVILPYSVVGAGAAVGCGTILNVASAVDHDCTVGDGCHICLHAVVKDQSTVPPCTKVEAGQVFGRDSM